MELNTGIYIGLGTLGGSLISIIGSYYINKFNRKNELEKIKIEYDEQRKNQNIDRVESKLKNIYDLAKKTRNETSEKVSNLQLIPDKEFIENVNQKINNNEIVVRNLIGSRTYSEEELLNSLKESIKYITINKKEIENKLEEIEDICVFYLPELNEKANNFKEAVEQVISIIIILQGSINKEIIIITDKQSINDNIKTIKEEFKKVERQYNKLQEAVRESANKLEVQVLTDKSYKN